VLLFEGGEVRKDDVLRRRERGWCLSVAENKLSEGLRKTAKQKRNRKLWWYCKYRVQTGCPRFAIIYLCRRNLPRRGISVGCCGVFGAKRRLLRGELEM